MSSSLQHDISQSRSLVTEAPQEYSIKNYRIGKSIGEGTFGKVKMGVHVPTSEKVAIKVLEKKRMTEAADVERVTREIHILRRIRHPHIIQLYDIIETKRQLFLITEYATGGELFDYIVSKQKLSEKEACRFFQQIISGVEYIHKLSIVHRDLKPENLLLDHNNSIKIIDFGLSNTYKEGETLKTACGSPCYAAPEMIAGKKYNGLLVDIWSCGVILYAMLCGYLPFEDPNTTELYKKILKGDFELPDFLSENAKDMLKKVLNTDPETRYRINEIRDHPWYSLVEPLENDEGIMVGYKPIPIDSFIISELNGFNIDPEYAKKCLEANRHNEFTTTYYLLVKKYQREGKKKVVDPNSSLPMQKALDASFNKVTVSYTNNSGFNGFVDSAKVLEGAKKRIGKAFDNANTMETPQCDTSFTFGNGVDVKKKRAHNGSCLAQYERNIERFSANNGNKKKEGITSYKSTPKSQSIVDDRHRFSNKFKDLPINLQIPKNPKQQAMIEKLRRKMVGKSANRDIPDSIRKRALDISKGDIKLQNQSCLEPEVSPTRQPTDWSFGIFAENNGNNDRLQKIYEIYQKVLSQAKAQPVIASAVRKPSTAQENIKVPHPPKTNSSVFGPRRQNRFIAKPASPYATKLDTHVRPSTRSQVRKNSAGKGVRKTTSRIEDRPKIVHGKNESTVGPITIIQAPLINTFNNYNSFNIGNVSLGQDSIPTAKPLVSQFRLRKYKNQGAAKGNKHNLSLAQ